MTSFDPNLPGVATGGYFAPPVYPGTGRDCSHLYSLGRYHLYRPVPTRPRAIIDASTQVDLFNPRVPRRGTFP